MLSFVTRKVAFLLLLSVAAFVGAGCGSNTAALPSGFVYLDEVIPNGIYDIRYYGTDNFLGTPVDGYKAPRAILTIEAAEALRAASEEFALQGYVIKVFDAYRPQKAVDHFIRWAADVDDTTNKARYYPDVDKKDLFRLGYIAERSGHSRGSTVDLTLVDLATGEELDMGSGFDFFGEISHHGTPLITPEQEANREILKSVMVKHGFKIYDEEWWHYTLQNEPYPDTYFDFDVQ